jgi:hypothetical protein
MFILKHTGDWNHTITGNFTKIITLDANISITGNL